MQRRSSLLACCLTLAALAFASGPALASDLDKFVPEGTNAYVHVNLKQMFGSSMLRKVLPKVADKYGENFIKMAAQANPQAAMLEGMWPQIQEALRDQEKVDQGFDAAADNVDGFVFCGNFSGEGEQDAQKFLILIGSKHMTEANVELVSGLIGGQMPGMLTEEKLGGKKVWKMTPPNSPMSFWIAIPAEGVLAMTPSKESAEKVMKGGKEPGFSAKIKPFIKNRTDKHSIFFVGENKKDGELGWGAITVAKDLDVNINVEMADAEKAKAKAAEMNEGFGTAIGQAETMLGESAAKLKPVFESVKKSKATADGNKVNMKINVTTDAVMKLLKD